MGNRKKNKNENILCAIIALMKELDRGGLEFVKMDCMKRLNAGSEEDTGEENMEVVDDHKYVMAGKQDQVKAYIPAMKKGSDTFGKRNDSDY